MGSLSSLLIPNLSPDGGGGDGRELKRVRHGHSRPTGSAHLYRFGSKCIKSQKNIVRSKERWLRDIIHPIYHWAIRCGVEVSKLVTLEKLRLNTECNTHREPHIFGLVSHLRFLSFIY